MPCSIARASFTRIRNNVSVNRALRTLSTHRIVRSNRPLSILSSTLNQTRFLNASGPSAENLESPVDSILPSTG
jgi:hypothetical protein